MMSDTDDTDVLLLIPPDFFLHTDSEESYNDKSFFDPCVVDTLISQIHRLESRVNKIELNSESQYSSSHSTIIPRSEMSEPLYKFGSYQDVYNVYMPSSSKSTPQKPKSRHNMSSLPNSPQTPKPGSPKYRRPPRFNYKLTPRIHGGGQNSQNQNIAPYSQNQSTGTDESYGSSTEKDDPKTVLVEIDQFLNNVKVIQNMSGQKVNLEKPILTLSDLQTNEEANKRFSQQSLQEMDKLIEGIEYGANENQNFVNMKDNRIESLYENKNYCQSEVSWQCGDNIDSVPELGYGMRDMLYGKKPNLDKQSSLENDDSERTIHTVIQNKTASNLSQSKSTPAMSSLSSKVNPSGVKYVTETDISKVENDDMFLETYPSNKTFSTVAVKSLPSKLGDGPTPDQSKTVSNGSLNLFSLADIWNTSKKQEMMISDKEMKKLLPKLEEEKCRRKHCEKLIQDLQMKILEMQQRLAVAVQVDSAKDEAILRFHEAWEKVANRWKSLETERNSLSQKLLSIQEKSSTELAEAAQKVVQYELEVSKALDLARTSQDKCNFLEKERTEFSKKLTALQIELSKSSETMQLYAKEKEKLKQKIIVLEKESTHDKNTIQENQNELSKQKALYQACNNEHTSLKKEYEKLEKKIQEKQSNIFILETEKNSLLIKVENMQKQEQLLQHQIKTLQEDSERSKQELRNFYQQQVEVLVKDKLKEFQEQLEQAEKCLQKDLHNREQIIAKTAAKQIQKLTEKHRLEVHLLEQKHKEEVRLCNLQCTQMKQQIDVLQNKLDTYHARRSNLAQELHNVMEQQWLEALRIINNQKSPLGESPRQLHESQRDSTTDARIAELRNMIFVNEERTDVQNERYMNKNRSKHTVTDMMCRSAPEEVFQTPATSRHTMDEMTYSEGELQKYIKLLLGKLPKAPVDEATKEGKYQLQSTSQDSSTTEFVDVSSSWPQLQMQKDKTNGSQHRSSKPPWK